MVKYLPTIICLIASAAIHFLIAQQMDILKSDPENITWLQTFAKQNPTRAKDCGIEYSINASKNSDAAVGHFQEAVSSLSLVFLGLGGVLLPFTTRKTGNDKSNS